MFMSTLHSKVMELNIPLKFLSTENEVKLVAWSRVLLDFLTKVL